MKKQTRLFITLFLFLLCLNIYSQAQVKPPGISWEKSDRLDAYPPNVSYPGGQSIDYASEDWWYDHKNSYIDGTIDPEKFNGFITCGYSNIKNIVFEEGNEGCDQAALISPYCEYGLDHAEMEVRNSVTFQTIGKYDQYGRLLWIKTFNSGWFSRIIQTDDGKYVAVGVTAGTREQMGSNILYYNPNGENADYFSNVGICPEGRKINIVKIDEDGNIIWDYLYGVNDVNVSGFELDNYEANDLVEYDIATSSKIRVVGSYNPGGYAYMIDVETSTGFYLGGTSFAPTSTSRNIFAIEKINISGDDFLATVGNDMVTHGDIPLEVMYFDNSSYSYLWDYVDYPAGSGPSANRATDLCFNSSGDLLIPVVYNCNLCEGFGEDTYGEGAVFKMTSATVTGQYQISDGTSPSDLLHAYDLMIGITNTDDLGFAIVTSKVINDFEDTYITLYPPYGEVEWYCAPYDRKSSDFPYWNADAFVRKYDASGNIEWSKSWDIDDNLPASYPGDQKRQECMYSISETPDLGLVVSGNNSRNFDDCYLVKLYDNCLNEQAYDFEAEAADGILELSEIGTSLTGHYNIRGSIVIHNGETLDISGSGTILYFADTRQCGIPTNIIVEPGGYLHVYDDAVLTSLACSTTTFSMWDGIQLWGDNQQSVQDPSTEPYVTIETSSTIENARYGVLVDKGAYAQHENWIASNQCMIKDFMIEETQAFGGGVLMANDANFHNCRFGVVFDAYEHPNASRIDYSEFKLDDYISDFDAVNANYLPLGINAHIKLFDVQNIIINENNFEIDLSLSFDNNDRGMGVGAFDSYGLELTTNTFENLLMGFDVGASIPANSFTASCNVMNNVIFGMRANNIEGPAIFNNNISIGEGWGTSTPYGMNLINCSGYTLQDNSITSSSVWLFPAVGLNEYFQTTNNNTNIIQHNDIHDFTYSTILEGEHNHQLNDDLGLKLWCNTFTEYVTAIAVTTQTSLTAGIAGIQDGSSGANNIFESYDCYGSEGEIFNPSGMNPIDYYSKPDGTIWTVEPITGCVTGGSQVSINVFGTTAFVKYDDCMHASLACGPSHRNISANQNQASGSATLRTRADADTTQLSQLDINDIIRYYQSHLSSAEAGDSIIAFLQENEITDRPYLLASAYQMAGRSTDLQTLLQSMNSDPLYHAFASVISLIDTTSWAELKNNNAVKDSLIEIANDSSSYGYSAARNILKAVYGYSFPDVINLPSPSSSFKLEKNTVESSVKVYPNPFSFDFYVELNGSDNLFELSLFNTLGETVKHISVPGNRTYKMESGDLPAGLYLLNVMQGNRVVFTAKLNHLD